MNTVEKRKLEGVITSAILEARTEYTSRRARELDNLVGKFENNPPDQVRKISVEYLSIQKTCEKQKQIIEKQIDKLDKQCEKKQQKLENKAEKLGYALRLNYRNEIECSLNYTTTYTGRYRNTPIRCYAQTSISKHEDETQKHLQKLDDLATKYTVSVWAESDDMSKLLMRFNTDIKGIVG